MAACSRNPTWTSATASPCPTPPSSRFLTDLFDRFNFTVMESTPFDIEVAVDPEMLGKVFEKLVTGRHESGSYYTPRPVVAFMCREALKGYLAGHNTGLSSEAVAAFVDDHHTSGVSITAALRLAAALEEVTVVDPACGSGAYLLGMMQELVELQTALFSDQLLADPRSLYELKLQIIQRNLYGADIDPFATNIAMLRLWLSLAIEYEGERPEPLPNLDFKIVCGDSLLGPDPDPTNLGDLFKNKAHEVAEQISVLKADHMNAIGAHKDRLKEEVETVQNELRRVLVAIPAPVGTVDWRVEFAEVFDGRGGFDIVVANPPYVRQELLTSLKTDLASLYPGVYDGRADILVYFYTRAGQLLHTGASLAFITSNSFTKRKYGKNLRSLLANQLTINTLIDFGEVKVFDATVEAYILIGRKTLPPPGSIVRGHNLYPLLTRKIGRSGNVEKAREEMGRLSEHLAAELSVFPQTRLNSWEWRIEDENINRLFERLTIQGTPLGEFANGRIYMGVKTGLNEAFVIDQFRRDELVAEDPRNAEIIRPWLRGRDIKTWRAEWAGLHIIYANRGVEIERYPAIQEHLALFRNRLENRATAHLHPWYELQQPQEGIHQYFIRPKIIWPVIARSVRFSYDISGSYINDRCHIMPSGMMWMLTVINSELFEFLLCQITNSLRGGFMQLFFHCTTRLPVVTPDATLQRRLESIAHAGVNGEPVDDDELNDMVYWLYGLSEKEVALVKGWFERRSLTTG